MASPKDVAIVSKSFHTVLKQKGFDSYVTNAEVDSIATFVVDSLDFDRAHRAEAPKEIRLSRAGLMNPPKEETA